jgi:ClpP class serine protease
MVEALADQFVADVQAARAGKLTIARDQLANGRLWTAAEAQTFGLVDDIATLEGLAATRFAGQRIHRYTPQPTLLQQLGMESMARQAMAEIAIPQVQ